MAESFTDIDIYVDGIACIVKLFPVYSFISLTPST
jgi:hypothetical protein